MLFDKQLLRLVKCFRSGRVGPVLTQKLATKDKEWFPGGRSWSKPKKSYPMKGFIHLVKSDSWRDWSSNPNMATKEFSPCFVFPVETKNIFHSSTVILPYPQNAVPGFNSTALAVLLAAFCVL